MGLRGGNDDAQQNATELAPTRRDFSLYPVESDSEGGQGKEASTEEEDKDRDFVLHLPGSR